MRTFLDIFLFRQRFHNRERDLVKVEIIFRQRNVKFFSRFHLAFAVNICGAILRVTRIKEVTYEFIERFAIVLEEIMSPRIFVDMGS